ncbi:hypothetical protein CKAH01_07278 [Colletotrichum kahawae]|uniref:Uncharacterized protein n=1 Tax=Colletotrichum kahawae TaxID=34407 RepID=A0AAD9Y6A5_COLKA|nr:hypothetical protein CKAH01_07278 [Colletotrichum kahawae]
MKFTTLLQSLASLSVAMAIPTESSQKMSPLERLLGVNEGPRVEQCLAKGTSCSLNSECCTCYCDWLLPFIGKCRQTVGPPACGEAWAEDLNHLGELRKDLLYKNVGL